jgi:hypothetical protein
VPFSLEVVMAKVEIIRGISGSRDGEDWPAIGGFLDVPEGEAEDLIRMGLARAVVKEERAVAPKSETATAKGPLTKASTGI